VLHLRLMRLQAIAFALTWHCVVELIMKRMSLRGGLSRDERSLFSRAAFAKAVGGGQVAEV
jgi:hypothetical protein